MATDISEALSQCFSYTKRGYDLARESCDTIHDIVAKEEERVSLANRQQNKIKRIDNAQELEQQVRNLQVLKKLERDLMEDLEILRRSGEKFSVVVFGRTMAGKSTLMEILRHGDGSSIGKGAQRTTRDVREYTWQKMRFTDVPGIASFDGEEDDRLAMEAAKNADLLLFLITDDAPQKAEAQKLKELRDLNIPVLGLVNVKMALNMGRRALTVRSLEKRMADTARLDAVCAQFRAYDEAFGQNWQDIPFVYTHLQAAYLGQAEHGGDAELYRLSNFAQVEEYILQKVQKDGCFLRIKKFINRVAIPVQQTMNELLTMSSRNAHAGLMFRYKWHGLEDWTDSFVGKAQDKYDSFMERLRTEVAEEISEFAARNYDNGNAGEAWNRHFQGMDIGKKCQGFMSGLSREAERKRRELTDDLRTEMRLGGINLDMPDISMDDITDTRSLMQLGALGVGLIFSGPIGIALGVLSFLFEDESEKREKQKRELREKLHEAMDPVLDDIADKVLDALNEQVFGRGIRGLKDHLIEMDHLLFGVAEGEAKSAKELRRALWDLNETLWGEAAQYVGVKTDKLRWFARLPGDCYYVMGNEYIMPGFVKRQMRTLLEENITSISLPDPDDDHKNFFKALDNLIGEWHEETLEFGEDGKLRLAVSDEDKPFDMLKEEQGYRLFQQIRCEPFLYE